MSRIEIAKPTVPALARFAERSNVPASAVVRAGDWVYVSGMPPVNAETGAYDVLPIDRQARRVLEHVKGALEAAGSSLDRVVKCTVYCSNAAYFGEINKVYAEYFGAHKPARTFLCTAGWYAHKPARTFLCTAGWFGPFDMEIDCVALAA